MTLIKDDIKIEFDSISPITGESSVIEENIEISEGQFAVYKLDISSGYQTYDFWKEDNKLYQEMIGTIPEYLHNKKITDDQGIVWFPSMFMKSSVVLHPIIVNNEIQYILTKLTPIKDKNDIGNKSVITVPTMIKNKVEHVLYELNESPIAVFPMKDFDSAFNMYNEIN